MSFRNTREVLLPCLLFQDQVWGPALLEEMKLQGWIHSPTSPCLCGSRPPLRRLSPEASGKTS